MIAGDPNADRYVGNRPTVLVDAPGLQSGDPKRQNGMTTEDLRNHLNSVLQQSRKQNPNVTSLFLSYVSDQVQGGPGGQLGTPDQLSPVSSINDLVSQANSAVAASGANAQIVVLEIIGHAEGKHGVMIGKDYVDLTNAADFAAKLAKLKLAPNAVIILSSCCLGCYTKGLTSVTGIVASKTGRTVFSPGGFQTGTFARYFTEDGFQRPGHAQSATKPGIDMTSLEGFTLYAKRQQSDPAIRKRAYQSRDDWWYRIPR